jgi:hypothetical protein
MPYDARCPVGGRRFWEPEWRLASAGFRRKAQRCPKVCRATAGAGFGALSAIRLGGLERCKQSAHATTGRGGNVLG